MTSQTPAPANRQRQIADAYQAGWRNGLAATPRTAAPFQIAHMADAWHRGMERALAHRETKWWETCRG